MDVTEPEQVRAVIRRIQPDAVVHCAAWTAVDAAEEQPDLCRKINGEGTRQVALACREVGCRMLYLSTDYVFDGSGERPWKPEDPPHPLNVYGQTKYEGEQAVQQLLEHFLIVRISWVFGRHGKNFVQTMLRLAETHAHLTVVDDQIGSPTYTVDLSRLLAELLEQNKEGIYHATNEGTCSWAEFAEEIFRQAGKSVTVDKIPSAAYPSKARRPLNSRLDKSRLTEEGLLPLPDWRDALRRFLEEKGA
jgi:dTDP-4-dehydrorhamnose reductase